MKPNQIRRTSLSMWAGMVALSIAVLQVQIAQAQFVDPEGVLETIYDGDVVVEDGLTAEEKGVALVEAMDNAEQAAEQIRQLVQLEKITIIQVDDALLENSTVSEVVDERRDSLMEMQNAIEGSALLYHAIDSRDLLVSDVIAVEFENDTAVRIYTFGEVS